MTVTVINYTANMDTITVGYWTIRGLAAPLRMMTMFAGYPLQTIDYDAKEKETLDGFRADEWFQNAKPDLILKNPLINLPYVIDGDVVISQSNACLSYLGRKFQLWGSSDSAVSECEQLLCEIMDLRNKMTGFAYGPPTTKDTAGRFLSTTVNKNGILQKLELWLGREVEDRKNSGTFLVGDRPTAPDFHLWEILDQFIGLSTFFELESPVATFPRLQFFHQSFGALPQNSKYLASKLYRLPYNAKMASFGATPSCHPWVSGQQHDWGDSSGIY